MSSPPPSTPTNTLKRPSISSSTSQSLAKKPRMHPLRQTSFPTTLDISGSFGGTSDAGSINDSFTGSLGGASGDGLLSAGGMRGKKRGRKSKAEKEREREREEALSSRAGRSVDGEGVSGRGGPVPGGGGGGGAVEEVEEDEDDDEGELLGREEGATDTEAEKKNLAILIDAFNQPQSERYDLFKRAKLRKESLRRIVNHALSQSVPASVVTTINGFTKVFAGEIIEKARIVQAEWAEAHDLAARAAFDTEEAAAKAAAQTKPTTTNLKTLTPPPTTARSGSAIHNDAVKKESTDTEGKTPSSVPAYHPPSDSTANPSSSLSPSLQNPGQPDLTQNPLRPKREFRFPPNPHRGQLLPSHLREALRRSKRDGEGGSVGFSGLSMENLGVSGAFTWSSGSVGGRRMFR